MKPQSLHGWEQDTVNTYVHCFRASNDSLGPALGPQLMPRLRLQQRFKESAIDAFLDVIEGARRVSGGLHRLTANSAQRFFKLLLRTFSSFFVDMFERSCDICVNRASVINVLL